MAWTVRAHVHCELINFCLYSPDTGFRYCRTVDWPVTNDTHLLVPLFVVVEW